MLSSKAKLVFGGSSLSLLTYSYFNHREERKEFLRHFSTLKTVGSVVKHYKNLDGFQTRSECHLICAKELLDLFKHNGGVYVKIGQHMASLVHLIPKEYTDTMQVLQDACLPSSYESLNAVFKEDYGKDIKDVFESFESEPIGVASLAQVHKATYKIPESTDQEPINVAVKIQHSVLKAQAEVDIALCAFLSKVIKVIFPDYEFDWLASEMAINLPLELSFVNEHKNTLRCQENFKNFKGIIIPKVYHSSPRILIMQFEQGCKITNTSALDSSRIDRTAVSRLLSKIYNEMIFKHHFVHCDPHPGNILVQRRERKWYHLLDRRNFNIVLYHGLYRQLDPLFIKDYSRFWVSIILADENLIDKYAYKIFTHNRKPEHGRIKHHRLFASIVCGRSWAAITKSNGFTGGIVSKRNSSEVESVQNNAKDASFFEAITIVLSKCPRELLLVIKTNDLLRSINEQLDLDNSNVLKYNVLQMAKYCQQGYQIEELDDSQSYWWNYWQSLKITLSIQLAQLTII